MLAVDREAALLVQSVCPECGGRFVDGLTCQDMFGVLLAWEWEDPELGAVHFLTVSAYLLQHPASLTEDARIALRAAFAEVVDGELTVEQVRARHSRLFAGRERVRRTGGEVNPQLRTWSMTIADVYSGGQPDAAGQVRRWAQAIRAEIETDVA